MGVEITIMRVKQKLQDLLKDRQIVDPRAQTQVKDLIESLTAVQELLKPQASMELKNKHHLEAVYLAEDTIDIFLLSRTNLLTQKSLPWFDLKSVSNRVHFSDKIKKLASDLKKVQLSVKASPDGSRSIIDDPEEEGESESKKFVARVLKSGTSLVLIPVVDVSARLPGKETMLRKIYDDLVRGEHFKCHGWVQISENFEKRKFVVDIMQQVLGFQEDEIKDLPFHSLKQNLRNFLISRRYLVVVFNVLTPDIWETLKCFFPNSSNGSRVILSFRGDKAGRHPDMEVTYFVCEDVDGGDVFDTTLQVPDAKFERLRGIFSDKESDIVGMKNETVKLAGLVLSQSELHSLIVVVGMAGSGKTTLVKTIYDHSHTRGNFGYFAWVNVYVSNVFDEKNVLIDILKQVKKLWVDEELSLEELESELKEFLSQKKFLIVLDDVHAPSAWNKLRGVFPLNSDSRIILITGYTNIARSVDPSVVVQLHPLNEPESWTLFLKKLRKDGNDEKLMQLQQRILQKCHGLPLAITVLGGFLSTKDFSDPIWLEVTEPMKQGEKEKEKKHGEQEGEQEENNATQSATVDEDPSASLDQSVFSDKLDPSRILDLGYQELSCHLRACLHYFCLFPKSYEIPIRRLFLLWLAEELAQTPASAGENKTIEDQIENNFNELEKRNMIEVATRRPDGSPKTCRLPSILYDKTFEDAQDMGSFHIYGKSGFKASEFNIHRLAEHSSIQNDPPSTEHIQNLRSYISFNTQKRDNPSGEIGNFLDKTVIRRGFGLLRVLDLENVYKPVLPEKIGRLLLLRYVGLRWTFLDSIPASIGDLPCLETLDMKHTNVTTLPISIWNAKKLRHLYMNEIHLPMSSQKSIASNSSVDLQTLWGLLIGSNNPPIDWLTGLKGLRKLGLTCHKASLDKINNWIFQLTSLQSLRLRSIDDLFEPSDLHLGSMDKQEKLTDLYLVGKLSRALDITRLPQNLRILTLSVSHLPTDPMPDLGKLQQLNILRLLAHSYIGEQMTCQHDRFPQLRVLKLWILKELKEWTVEEGAMPALRELEIRHCARLKKANGLEKLTTLKKVTLTDMQQDFVTEVKQSLSKSIIIHVNEVGY